MGRILPSLRQDLDQDRTPIRNAARLGRWFRRLTFRPTAFDSFGLVVELSVVRSGDAPARVSQNFLAEINEEKYVQAGMVADAGDEPVQLTRRHFFIMFHKLV